MNYEQLYIDDVLMDTDEKTNILLELKSNLFADISKMTSNKTYTIHLPKTVHNLTVLGHADRIGNNADWPYRFHSARFFRNGVELIKDGRAALLSAADDLEIAIVWGLASPFEKLKGDIRLNQLGGGESIPWSTVNTPDTPSAFFARGYGYVGYTPWINDKTDEGWKGMDVTHTQDTVTTYHVNQGYTIDTGEKVGDIVNLNPEANAGWGYLVLPFRLTTFVIMNHVVGGDGNNRLWSILDAYDRVLQISSASTSLQSTLLAAPANAAKLVININVVASQQDYVTMHRSVDDMTPASFGGQAGTFGVKYIHPSVSAKFVLDKIASKLGVTCQWSGDEETFINSLAIPLIKKKANSSSAALSANAVINPATDMGGLTMQVVGSNDIFVETPDTTVNQLTVARDCGVSLDVQATWSWDASDAVSHSSTEAKYGGSSRTMYQFIYFANYIEMTITRISGDDEVYIIGKQSAPSAHQVDQYSELLNNRFQHTIAGYGHIDLHAGDKIEFELKNKNGKLQDMRLSDGQINAIVDSSDDVLKGNNFPIVDNLPDIKVADFIKFLSAITGTWPLQKADGDTITFVPVATLWSNIPNAVDWTRKVIPAHGNDKPKELDYKMDGWAQQNWYRWADDDTVIGDYDGHIDIDDKTLDKSRDIFVFPFAATDGRNIPTYTRPIAAGTFGGSNVMSEATTEEPDYNECKPRIAAVRADANGKAELFFDINMQTILAEKYSHMTSAMQDVRIIKDDVRLSNIEILNFDERTPVYLAQHASYFAVLEIKAAANGSAEVTMLKIK